MDEPSTTLLLGLLALCLALSAFFSGTETALMSINRYRLRHRAREGSSGARAAERLLSQPDRLIGLILVCNNFVNSAAAAIVTVISLSLGGEPRQDSQDPTLLAAFGRILAACKAAGKRVGVHTTSVAYSQQMIAMGFDLVTVGADLRWLMGGRAEATAMREHIRDRR